MLNPAGQAEMREFYDLAFKLAWQYLARITGGDITLTEDLIQDVMLSVAKDLARGRSPKHDGGWITVVARNRFLNHVRSSARSDAREQASVDRSFWPPPGTEDRVLSTEGARQLLATLPVDQRAAVALRHLDGYTTAEIATQLGRTIEATESLIARGVRTLRKTGTREV
jgi:RNA polymerase sigma-70 factor, ECF subfamily